MPEAKPAIIIFASSLAKNEKNGRKKKYKGRRE